MHNYNIYETRTLSILERDRTSLDLFWRIGITKAIVGFLGEMGFSKRVDLLNVRSGDVYDGLPFERWTQLGLPIREANKFKLKFDTVVWDKPVFGEVATKEQAEAKVATIQSKQVTFDPEFKLFCSDGKNYSLAGLRPWRKTQRGDVLKHRPIADADPIGELACYLARQREADFVTLSANSFYNLFPNLQGTRYLLFATHPMREAETNTSKNALSYLTFYAFGDSILNNDDAIQHPLHSEGAYADDVYSLICLLETEALTSETVPMEIGINEQALAAASNIAKWLKSERELPRLGRQTYFLPIPVALVAIL